VESDRVALALLGCNFYGHPAEAMTMIGVTGTNGKTSTTLLLKQVLETTIGAKVGLIGTMANMVGDEIIPTERTTPESFELQALFARMRDAGCTHVVMEVSSHAITLERIGGTHFDIAAFTNLTEDHLDFHKTMDAYCEAKADLFRRCDRAVINVDDGYASEMIRAAACPVLTTSVVTAEGLHAKNLKLLSEGISFTAICGEGLKADELWLIQAADEAALERIEVLAQSRKTAKMDETSFYSPDQYAICEDGRIVTEGLYMAFIVSPEAEAMEKAFIEAVK